MFRRWRCLNRNIYAITCLLAIFTFWYIVLRDKSKPSCSSVETKSDSVDQNKSIDTFFLVLVLSGPRNRDRRDAIRNTWLSDLPKRNVHHLFVLGTKGLEEGLGAELDEEQDKYHDLLMLSQFQDAYEKLTEKLGKSLVWVAKNANFRYLFKCDDDTYARMDILESELRGRQMMYPSEMLYMGYFYGKGNVKKSGPWKETEWKLCDLYIPYARGGGYILSFNVASYVAANFAHFKRYLSEDVSMGSWLAPLDINRVHNKQFDTEYKTRGCSNSFVVSHKQSIEDMYEKHGSLKASGKLCQKEYSIFHGYEYDWSVPPSKCCSRHQDIP